MDIQYLLLLQNMREAMGGVLDSFFLQISDLSYGIFIWMLACVLFWSVNKKSGWFLERRFVRFSMDVSALQKVTRASVGVLLLIFIEKCLTPAVTGAFSSSWVNCLMTFLELFLLMVVYPLCFSRLEGSGTERRASR